MQQKIIIILVLGQNPEQLLKSRKSEDVWVLFLQLTHGFGGNDEIGKLPLQKIYHDYLQCLVELVIVLNELQIQVIVVYLISMMQVDMVSDNDGDIEVQVVVDIQIEFLLNNI